MLNELSSMAKTSYHDSMVNLIGIAFDYDKGQILIVMELMSCDLSKFLKDSQEGKLSKLAFYMTCLNICRDIMDGLGIFILIFLFERNDNSG